MTSLAQVVADAWAEVVDLQLERLRDLEMEAQWGTLGLASLRCSSGQL